MDMYFISNNYKKLLVYLAIFLIGLIFIIFPGFISKFLGIIVGFVLLLISGFKIAEYFMARNSDITVSPLIVGEGILGVLIGLSLIFVPSNFLSTLAVLLGFYFIINGIIKMKTMLALSVFRDFAWWASFIGAILIFILGFIIVINPFSSSNAIIILFGICLILTSLQQVGELYNNRFKI